MKPETLDALLIDRELGELPADVVELLDTYLELAPTDRQEAEAVSRTISITRETVRRFPELARGTEQPSPPNIISLAQWFTPWMARAAVVAAVAVTGGWLGYRAGTNSVSVQSARLDRKPVAETVVSRPTTADTRELWARYNVAFDQRRGELTIAVQP